MRNSSAPGGNFCHQQVAALAGAAFGDFGQHLGQSFADAGNVGDLAFGVAQDIDDTLRVAFDGSGAVAIAANAEAIFGGDLHQIGGFPEDARDFLVLQTGSSIQLYRVGLDLLVPAARRLNMLGLPPRIFRNTPYLFRDPDCDGSSGCVFRGVNAASYGNAIAPDSLATIFGSNLAPATASATLDANGQLPTELASTRVEFNGVAAALFYVSPGQINVVVPGGLTPGTASVVIRSTVSGSTQERCCAGELSLLREYSRAMAAGVVRARFSTR